MKPNKLKMNELTKSITVEVTISGCTVWRIKKYVGVSLIKLGIYIMGMNAEIKE